MKQLKKALAVVAGPYRFYQVLWLYTQFSELEWSILLLPYGNGDRVIKDLHEKSERAGIFKHIYRSDMIGQDSGVMKQIVMFLKMFGYFMIGKRKHLMKQIIRSQTEGNEYDVYFVGCEYSIIEGAIIGLADEKEVYIFEEGLSDYTPRKKYPSLNWKEIISFCFTKMGYFSPYQTFELDHTIQCVKFASLPELLRNRTYKEIRSLFERVDGEFDKLSEKVYHISTDYLKQYDVILFTTVFGIHADAEYMERVHAWISEHYAGKRILIKKHPRDDAQYDWDDIECYIGGENVPAEVLLNIVDKQEILMMDMSTMIVSVLNRKHQFAVLVNTCAGKKYNDWIAYAKDLLKISEQNIICI